VPDPAPWLLTVQDFPTGWTSRPNPDSTSTICDGKQQSEIAQGLGGREARAYFQEGNSNVAQEATFALQDEATAQQFFDQLIAEIDCTTWNRGEDGTATIGEMSFPALGSESKAYRAEFKSGGTTADVLYVFVRQGSNALIFGQGGFFVDTTDFESLAKLALAQLPA
jgi:hypothetical protein